ncbi:ATP-dependent Clp protease adaptor ClpS [Flavobacterium agricola]|uniref:ATP-dependent Clp protease adaptor ClpS n=1 Tax=Flavobacterium agricola TaxID=2870839 RepID=A0ABY6M1N8_9FLAO|nr:ATP-dependent Clp protease adaptor ClpS [Flavobacterium agricola]UYW02429.1 ATP-dependent Clp protease adaptor ClpS [Flavobacterium agricola]
MSYKEEVLEEVSIKDLLSDSYEIILFNDDHNTFDHVIKTLIKVCKHDNLQAEQCALLVHYTGKCGVKTGSRKELEPLCSKLLDADLTVEIQ